MHIIDFEYGRIRTFDELPDNAIALDGAVQGPAADPGRRRFSFDHHAGCLRLVTLATCEQVLVALDLGLVVDPKTIVFANDIDADTVLSLWLLRIASESTWYGADNRVRDLVRRVGLADAHGPVFEAHPLHRALGPEHGDTTPQTLDMLDRYLGVLDAWHRTDEMPAKKPPVPGEGWGLRATGSWTQVTTPDGFGPLYKRGFLAAALVTPANDGTLSWTIGKRSDLVPLALGPADASKDRSGDYLPTLLGELAKLEAEVHGVSPRENWGGGTSIGGSPRLPGGIASRISEQRVVAILDRFRIG